MDILEKIVLVKKKSLKEEKNKLPLKVIKQRLKSLPLTRNFLQAISSSNKIHLIAEIKKASPLINYRSRILAADSFDPVRIAQEYELAGASAISVLTEENFFLGNLGYLEQVKKVCNLPILHKDFIFDSYQIYQSRYYGGDAFLLIASLLKKEQIEEFISLGEELGMDTLVEVHNEEELEKVLKTQTKIIGINNRNLKDLSVDLNVTLRLGKKIPKDRIVVSESGIRTRKDVKLLKNAGVNAVLIGETLMQSKNIKEKVKELGLAG